MFARAAEPFSIESFLAEEQSKDLLRFTTAGSVDDGKSTLIGRLLYDSKAVYEDQIRAVKRASAGELDLALFTDGLRAEREQGITIDVAYRYFATARRKFIIADTPGHEEYTRNMATGASTADLAIILIDARHGVQPQSRRHAFIAALLGIPNIVVAVNKMDLVDYSHAVFLAIEREFRPLHPRAWFVPISAREGDNVVRPSRRMPWFQGPALLEYLETVPLASTGELSGPGFFRFPVQRAIRTNHGFRGYAGQIAAGLVRPGDEVTALPSGRRARVKSIETFDGRLNEAAAPMSVTLTLDRELDISRGDLLTAGDPPQVARSFAARAVWMHADPLTPAKPYLLKHTCQTVSATVSAVRSLEGDTADRLALNDLGVLAIETSRPLYFDPYGRNRATGSAILIDPHTNATIAALMLVGAEGVGQAVPPADRRMTGKTACPTPVTLLERASRFGHGPAAIALRGSAARKLERLLFDRGANVAVLTHWDDAARVLVESAGLLALVTGHSHALPSPGALPADDDAAAAKALAFLLETGIL